MSPKRLEYLMKEIVLRGECANITRDELYELLCGYERGFAAGLEAAAKLFDDDQPFEDQWLCLDHGGDEANEIQRRIRALKTSVADSHGMRGSAEAAPSTPSRPADGWPTEPGSPSGECFCGHPRHDGRKCSALITRSPQDPKKFGTWVGSCGCVVDLRPFEALAKQEGSVSPNVADGAVIDDGVPAKSRSPEIATSVNAEPAGGERGAGVCEECGGGGRNKATAGTCKCEMCRCLRCGGTGKEPEVK